MKTRNTTSMTCNRIPDRRDIHRPARNSASRRLFLAAARLAVIGALAAGLGACASGPSSSMFVDPAKYDLYNCEQLATARKVSNDRVVELERLMAKAESGAGGTLVSGLAYQTDFLAERARRDQIDEKIASNNCSTMAPAAPAPAAPPTKRRRG
ncbi:MAG: hypothetical protein ACRC9K_01645 [Afipia sp.]